jgi:CobQ-like glutamine amidotransferase family enzyme
MKKNTNYKLPTTNYRLTLGWLYPELMSIYGDRGNIIVLQKRCEWRGIQLDVKKIDQTSSEKNLASCNYHLATYS